MARISTPRGAGRSNTMMTGTEELSTELFLMLVTDFHYSSHFGHDKSLEIKPYAALPADKRPTLLYAGDGVSDLSAAAETDLLFAKKGHGRFCFHFSSRSTILTVYRFNQVLRARGNAVHRFRGLVEHLCHYQRHLRRQSLGQECCRGREGYWALNRSNRLQ
jgi:hypothetical protein